MKKIRGYKRKLAETEAEIITVLENIDLYSWFNLWHIHTDPYGLGNFNYKNKVQSLARAIRYFITINGILKSQGRFFLSWILIDMEDFSETAVYVHTENPFSAKGYTFDWVDFGFNVRPYPFFF